MDRNTIIGLSLIFILLLLWQQFTQPSAEELAEQQRMEDSLAIAQRQADSLARIEEEADGTDEASLVETPEVVTAEDTVAQAMLESRYGVFAASAQGEAQTYTLENSKMEVSFSNRGGRITEVILKEYNKVIYDEEHDELKVPLRLLEDPKNRFEYLLPVPSAPNGVLSTRDLFFDAEVEGQRITFTAKTDQGGYIRQTYRLQDDHYLMDYDLALVGLENVLSNTAEGIELNWKNYLDRIERNTTYEQTYARQYYRTLDEDLDYIDQSTLEEPDMKWISHTNQFFNSTLIAGEKFKEVALENETTSEESENLKVLHSRLLLPWDGGSEEVIAMQMYVGPNEFDRLRQIGYELEQVIPFGWSIFGTINRWIIRPLFNFLSGFIGSKGIVILFLTILVKLALYPLTYRMLYSQSKMGALKPRMASLKEKYKDDQQQYQVESMKIYREFGVSPFGGCLPMVLQMPIWFALYRFFPAAIEFRQAGFLWATDLSSYDVFFWLPFEEPLPYIGGHISLFTLLWAITTLIYTFYNTRHMDMSANPAMKYMQYIMPIFFLGFFNSFASGLTCYLLFSNLFNIAQTLITKNFIIDKKKIEAELEAYRKKPKKKGGFQERLEKALKEQQRVQAERAASGSGGKKGKRKR